MYKYFLSMLVVLITFIFSGLVNQAYCQVNNLNLTSFSVKDGLSQGTINSMLQDQAGFIWFANDNGIDIYDGYGFRTLTGPNDIFLDTSVSKLIEDDEGLIWLILDEKRIYTYDPKTDVYQLIPTKIPENEEYYFADIIKGNDKNIWLLTSKSLNVYNKVTGEYRLVFDAEISLASTHRFMQMTLHENVIYAGSTQGIFAYDLDSKKWVNLPDLTTHSNRTDKALSEYSNYIYTLSGVGESLYIGSADGVFKLNVADIKHTMALGEKQLKNHLPQYKLLIPNIAPWNHYLDGDTLNLATDKGLFTINTITEQTEFLFGYSDYHDDVTNNNIISIFKDRQGSFWLGSKANGVYIWDPNRGLINNYRYKKNDNRSLSHNEVWSIVPSEYHEGWVWVGTSNGLNLLDINQNNVKTFLVHEDTKKIFTENYIRKIFELNPQQLLLYTAEGMRLFDVDQEAFQPLPYSDDVMKYLNLYPWDVFYQDGLLWLSNEQGIQQVNLSTNEVMIVDEVNTLFTPEQSLRFLNLTADNITMLLTSYNALWGYNTQSGKITKLYEHLGVLKGEWVDFDSTTVDGKGILWLAYPTKGLIGLSLDTFNQEYFYHQANSIIDNNVYGLMTDEQGDIWFSTHNGVFLLNADTHHIRQFSAENGLVATEFNSRAFAPLGKEFIYGSMQGVSLFDPIALKQVSNEGDFGVRITAVNVLSRQLSVPLVIDNNAEISLEYDDIGIRVDYSTLLKNSHNSIVFDVTLSGEHSIHYPQTTDHFITFPSLSSGAHTLIIRAKSPETGQLSSPVKLRLFVSYAPWLSPFAYILYGLIGFILLFIFYQYRRKQKNLLAEIHEQVKFREKRLQLALTGSNSEAWDWQASDNMMFGKRIFIDLGYPDQALFYDFSEHIALLHPKDKDMFISKWTSFIEQGSLSESFDCTYRLKSETGQWLWYKDLGKIVAQDSQGNPSRVTGSYTNITQSKADEERALYYGDAFKQTKDWVLILDEKLTRITANQSIREVFSWREEEFDFDINVLGIETHRVNFYRDLLMSLKEGSHWRGEELVTTDSGEKYYVIVNVTVGKNAGTNVLHYIFVLTDITAQKTAENELRYLANYDHLTGLPNRTLLLDRIAHAIDFAKRKESSIALFFIDLDRFKQVNDSLGHDYGDLLLKEITERLKEALRSDDTVARIGGDEFVVLLESFSGNNQLGRIAQKVIDVVSQPVSLNNKVVGIGASIGIALYPDDSSNSDLLIRNADVAMYHAKKCGRNNFQFFTDEMNDEAKSRLDRESKLKLAVNKGEFVNHYQAIVDANTGKAVGFEMLLRWKSGNEIISPDKFIALSEELGLIIALTEAAIDRGLRVLKQWHIARPDTYLSVNLSAQHFSKDNLVPYIEKLLELHQVPAQSLRIEVTESALILEPEKAISTMCALSALGVTLALDDFGTGFSSLAYLKQLPLDIIKIDRTFVSGIGINKADEAIIDTTIVLSKRLGLSCIAEGVETQAQLHYLVDKGCHFIQGYLYGKPEPAQKVMQRLTLNETEIMAK